MTSLRKILKMLVWSAQNRSISSEICCENNHKIGCFLPIAFWWSLPRKLPRNSREIGRFFREFIPKNPMKFDFFFRDLLEALLRQKRLKGPCLCQAWEAWFVHVKLQKACFCNRLSSSTSPFYSPDQEMWQPSGK